MAFDSVHVEEHDCGIWLLARSVDSQGRHEKLSSMGKISFTPETVE